MLQLKMILRNFVFSYIFFSILYTTSDMIIISDKLSRGINEMTVTIYNSNPSINLLLLIFSTLSFTIFELIFKEPIAKITFSK